MLKRRSVDYYEERLSQEDALFKRDYNDALCSFGLVGLNENTYSVKYDGVEMKRFLPNYDLNLSGVFVGGTS